MFLPIDLLLSSCFAVPYQLDPVARVSRKGTASINVSTDARVAAKRAFVVKVANHVNDVEKCIRSVPKSRSRRVCAPTWPLLCSSFGIARRANEPSWLVRIVVGITKRWRTCPLCVSRWSGSDFFFSRSATINDLVRGVLRGAKNVFMLDGGRSLSSCVAKDVDRRTANARMPGLASSALNKGKSA